MIDEPSTWFQSVASTSTTGFIRIRMVEDGGPVGGGGSNPRYITDEDGRKWIMKGTFLGGQDHAYLRFNEGLCALIAQRLSVPVPQPAAVLLTLDQLHGFKAGTLQILSRHLRRSKA